MSKLRNRKGGAAASPARAQGGGRSQASAWSSVADHVYAQLVDRTVTLAAASTRERDRRQAQHSSNHRREGQAHRCAREEKNRVVI
jgi:hypothetical protein